MSTSRTREIFVDYMDAGEEAQNVLWHLTPRAPSQIHRWRERETVFCRGADISMLSQFAAEAEGECKAVCAVRATHSVSSG